MKDEVKNVAEYVATLYHDGIEFSIAVEKALDEFCIFSSERKKIRSMVCSILGKRGVNKKASVKKKKQRPVKKLPEHFLVRQLEIKFPKR
jgi:hypothetical protein